MQSLVSCEKRLNYKLTTVYIPVLLVFIALVCTQLAFFQFTDQPGSFLLIIAALSSLWLATLFFEVVSFEINHEDDSVRLNRIAFSKLKLISERKTFRLSELNCIWIESFGSHSSRLTFRFSDAWLPLTSMILSSTAVKKIESPIRSWLEARGLTLKTGEGILPPSQVSG